MSNCYSGVVAARFTKYSRVLRKFIDLAGANAYPRWQSPARNDRLRMRTCKARVFNFTGLTWHEGRSPKGFSAARSMREVALGCKSRRGVCSPWYESTTAVAILVRWLIGHSLNQSRPGGGNFLRESWPNGKDRNHSGRNAWKQGAASIRNSGGKLRRRSDAI